MISIGNLRALARDMRNRHDDAEIAEVLDSYADTRSVAYRAGLDGGPGWMYAAEIPEGTVFCAATRPKGLRWRREGEMCRALPPMGNDRLYTPADIDAAHRAVDHAGYVRAEQ